MHRPVQIEWSGIFPVSETKKNAVSLPASSAEVRAGIVEDRRAAQVQTPSLALGTDLAEGKPIIESDGREWVLEKALRGDFALIKAYKTDPRGNLTYHLTARNFNPPAAMCGRVCVAEVEEIVPREALDGDAIHLPGIYVHRIIQGDHEKRIEQLTTRTRKEI